MSRADTSSVTPSRTCRPCGAELPGVVRWCLRCHEPVRDLSPREPAWQEGEFVGRPIHKRGSVPHWSRWEKSTTTFGPIGRCVVTVFAALWILSAAVRSPLTIVFVLPLMVALIRSVWQRGWVVPEHLAANEVASAPEPVSQSLWNGREAWRSVATGVCGWRAAPSCSTSPIRSLGSSWS